MAEHWPVVRLGDLVAPDRAITYGIVQPGNHTEGGIPIVRVNNVRDGRIVEEDVLRVSVDVESKYSRTRLRGGEVLLTLVGTLGEVAVVPSRLAGWNLARAVAVIPVRDDVGAEWVAIWLRSREAQHHLKARATTTVQATLNLGDVSEIPIALPAAQERAGIVEVARAIDDGLALNREMNKTLESIARALFRSWFVDFDPVRAKKEGRPTGLPDEVAALFPDRLVASPVGDMPEGWGERLLPEAVDILSGGTPRRNEATYWNGDVPWFSVRDTPAESDVFVLRTEEHITPLGIDNSAAQLLPVGTTIITARGTVGNLALTSVPMAMNQSCFGIKGKQWGDVFTFYTMRQMVDELQRMTHGSVFDTINRSTFAAIRVLDPPTEVRAEFERTVAPLFARIRLNSEQNFSLAALRDTLLPKLLSGEVRVAEGAI